MARVFGDVVFQDAGFQRASLKPLTHIGFRCECEVPTPSVFEGQSTIIFKPHILKHHISELPNGMVGAARHSTARHHVMARCELCCSVPCCAVLSCAVLYARQGHATPRHTMPCHGMPRKMPDVLRSMPPFPQETARALLTGAQPTYVYTSIYRSY